MVFKPQYIGASARSGSPLAVCDPITGRFYFSLPCAVLSSESSERRGRLAARDEGGMWYSGPWALRQDSSSEERPSYRTYPFLSQAFVFLRLPDCAVCRTHSKPQKSFTSSAPSCSNDLNQPQPPLKLTNSRAIWVTYYVRLRAAPEICRLRIVAAKHPYLLREGKA